jgi:hypothetical protein
MATRAREWLHDENRGGGRVKCNHYWDATDIPGICICICGASRFYNRQTGEYVVTIWEEVGA